MWSFFKRDNQKEEESKEREMESQQTRLEIENEHQKAREMTAKLKENYEITRHDYGYTKRHNGVVTLNKKKFYAFVSDQHLKFFVVQPKSWDIEKEKMPQWDRRSIAIRNILYFSREGEVYTETKISGGGGGGSSIGGAIIGGIVAGAPGAIIASRGKTQEIKSETITHDTRKTVLVTNKGNLEFAPEDYSVFMKLIPEKELSVVKQKKAMEATKKSAPATVEERLEKLASLKAKELISEEEYQEKRQKILDEI